MIAESYLLGLLAGRLAFAGVFNVNEPIIARSRGNFMTLLFMLGIPFDAQRLLYSLTIPSYVPRDKVWDRAGLVGEDVRRFTSWLYEHRDERHGTAFELGFALMICVVHANRPLDADVQEILQNSVMVASELAARLELHIDIGTATARGTDMQRGTTDVRLLAQMFMSMTQTVLRELGGEHLKHLAS